MIEVIQADRFAPVCIWCSAPWSDENVKVWNFDAADQCASGRLSPESVTVSIVCHSCKREIYRKDGVENCYGDPGRSGLG